MDRLSASTSLAVEDLRLCRLQLSRSYRDCAKPDELLDGHDGDGDAESFNVPAERLKVRHRAHDQFFRREANASIYLPAPLPENACTTPSNG